MRTAEQNADEFRALTRQGKDMRLAALVACSVAKGTAGRPALNREDHHDFQKMSASAFADRAGTSKNRVLLHLNVWNELCDEQGFLLLPHADSLTPADVDSIEISDEAQSAWDKQTFYPKGRAVLGNATAVADALESPEFLAKVLGKMDGATRDALISALLRHGDNEEDHGAHHPRERKQRDFGRLVESAVNNISMALAAAGSGRWEPSPLDEALLYFLSRLLGERVAPEGELSDMVQAKLDANLDEIERFANAGGAL